MGVWSWSDASHDVNKAKALSQHFDISLPTVQAIAKQLDTARDSDELFLVRHIYI
jgi:hypothetical protein